MTQLVFGIDMIRRSAAPVSDAVYGLVRVTDSRIESEERDLTFSRLLHLIETERPALVAAGSLQDIAPDNTALFQITDALPYETRLVRIIGNGPAVSLSQAAAKYNLRFDKSNRMEAAKTSALIASFGGGEEVRVWAGETSVTVSPARALIRIHRNRRARRMLGPVMSVSRKIEADLLAKGLMFVSSLSRSSKGDRGARFTVSAPRHEVPVTSGRSGGVKIHVAGTRRDLPEFVPLTAKPPYLIVGIDPGTTVGIAALDLEGDLVSLSSSRALGQAEIISAILSVGRPVLIATDKAEMPFAVEKVRRAFSAAAWTPGKDVLIKEKYDLAEGYDFSNDHERDALSAAVSAYRSYANKFESVQKRVPPGTDIDLVRAGIIRGLSLEQILETLKHPKDLPDEPVIIEEEPVPDEKDERIQKLEESVAKLRKLVGSLSEEVEVKDKAIAALQKRLVLERDERETKILSSEEVSSREEELVQVKKALRKEERRSRTLRVRLERMKHFISLQAGDGCTALKVLQLLAKDHVKSLDDEMGVGEEDILYVLTIDGWGRSVIRDLAEAKIGAVILPRLTYQRAQSQHLIEEFREADIPILDGANLSPRVKGKIGVVDTAAFESALADWKTTQEVYQNEKKIGEIRGMVEEYQVERVKDVREKGIDPSLVFEVERPKPEVRPAPPVPEKPSAVFRPKPLPPAEKPAPREKPVSRPAEKSVPKPGPVRPVPSAPKPAAKPAPKKEKPVKRSGPPGPETGSAEKILFGVLSEYREERKKELKK